VGVPVRAARVAAVLVAESEVARVAVKWGGAVAGLEVVWAAEREAETCERENERRIGSALR
jgi:hypothetical protein